MAAGTALSLVVTPALSLMPDPTLASTLALALRLDPASKLALAMAQWQGQHLVALVPASVLMVPVMLPVQDQALVLASVLLPVLVLTRAPRATSGTALCPSVQSRSHCRPRCCRPAQTAIWSACACCWKTQT